MSVATKIDLSKPIRAEQMRPLYRRVVIRRMSKPEKTEGGVWLTQDTTAMSQLGEVLRVAKDVREVTIGDIVIFPRWPAIACATNMESDDLVFCREDDIQAIVEF